LFFIFVLNNQIKTGTAQDLFFLISHNDISWYITPRNRRFLTVIYHELSWWYITLIYHDRSSRYIMIDQADISWYITLIYHDKSSRYIMICQCDISWYITLTYHDISRLYITICLTRQESLYNRQKNLKFSFYSMMKNKFIEILS
jgi:hypothetical protein